MIDWRPMSEMPSDLKDGREVLIAEPNRLGTFYGGDGVKLNSDMPYLIDIGAWHNGVWEIPDGDECRAVGDSEIAYFAEITYPN